MLNIVGMIYSTADRMWLKPANQCTVAGYIHELNSADANRDPRLSSIARRENIFPGNYNWKQPYRHSSKETGLTVELFKNLQ